MTKSSVVYTNIKDTVEAGKDLCRKIADDLEAEHPDALVVFAAPNYEQELLLRVIADTAKPAALVGASSAGEFTSGSRGEGMACALALRSSEMHFSVGIGRGLDQDRKGAAQQIVSSFKGLTNDEFAYRSALVMADALAGHSDDLVDELTLATRGKYQFVGGGAGDNAKFQRTAVFFGTSLETNAAVALEILSRKPLGIGVSHGWTPASRPMRVTEAKGSTLVSLNGLPAVQAFRSHAEATGQSLDSAAPIPFFLHNILGIETGGEHRLRVPLAIQADGSVACAADIPTGAIVHIMKSTSRSAAAAASQAATSALEGLRGNKPQVALFFDCVATRLRLGEAFGYELEAVAKKLGTASFAGCNTHGQIARSEGQFGGFHNCTAVVCAFPE